MNILVLLVLYCCCSFAAVDFDEIYNNLRSSVDYRLQKRTSTNNRLLFVAGLEGTGHHAVASMFQVCLDAKINKCQLDKRLTLMMYKTDQESPRKGLFFAEDAERSMEHVENIYSRMKRLASFRGNNLFVVGLAFVHGAGMMSYPNFNKGLKSINNPDVFLLAALAERAGLDFRVLVLQRGAGDILNSAAKRNFGGSRGTAVQPQIMIDAAAALSTQLQLLGKDFFHCIHYHKLGNMSDVDREAFVSFVHPLAMGQNLREMAKKVVYASSPPPTPVESIASTADKSPAEFLRAKTGNSVFTQQDPSPEHAAFMRHFHETQLASRLELVDSHCRRVN